MTIKFQSADINKINFWRHKTFNETGIGEGIFRERKNPVPGNGICQFK